MREIMFRGKRTDNDEWVFGLYVKSVNDRAYIIVYATEDAVNTRNEIDFLYIEVLPATVGQFTGLRDKNGKEIYEGDIVACGDGEVPTLIEWHDESHSYLAYNLKRKEYHSLDKYFIRFIGEVVGNIHDNPEPMDG